MATGKHSFELERAETVDRGRARPFSLAPLALAGLMAFGCQSQNAQVPPVIGVKDSLARPPMGLREENQEPGAYPLNGKLASCRGVAACVVEIYPGDLFMALRLEGEYEAHVEITVSSMGGGSVTLQRRTDSVAGDFVYDNQTLRVGASAQLFNTDLSVTAMSGENGRYFISVR